MFGDFLSAMLTLTHAFEAHGKEWLEVEALRFLDDDHVIVIAVEKAATFPAPLQLVLRKKRPAEPLS